MDFEVNDWLNFVSGKKSLIVLFHRMFINGSHSVVDAKKLFFGGNLDFPKIEKLNKVWSAV